VQQPSPQPSQSQPSRHPDSSALRRRAADLRMLARSIERSLVMVLADAGDTATWRTDRVRLCDQMLSCNLHQLHRAADDLRESALRYCQLADELDLTRRVDVA